MDNTFVTIGDLQTVTDVNDDCKILMDDGINGSNTKNIAVSTLKNYLIDNVTPTIDETTGNWVVNGVDTGVKASEGGIELWKVGEIYPINSFVYYDGSIYKCVVSPQADNTVFNKDEWVALSGNVEFCNEADLDEIINELFKEKVIVGYIDITPIMTSNTTPEPYVVSVSHYWGVTYDAWKAFDNINDENNCWSTRGNVVTGWIMIDFSVPTTIREFRITSRNSILAFSNSPKDFALYGSNDETNFTLIKEFVNQTDWGIAETRSYLLDEDVTYRYYKIEITSNNGGEITNIGELKFYQAQYGWR